MYPRALMEARILFWQTMVFRIQANAQSKYLRGSGCLFVVLATEIIRPGYCGLCQTILCLGKGLLKSS